MINEETIKSLYNDKPTLLEWLKRVEAQLEELKKITNFDTLTANNAEINQKLLVKGNPVAKAIYMHKVSWKYTSTSPNVYLYYLSVNPLKYDSMAGIFGHIYETNLNTSEIVEYNDNIAIVKFSPTGAVKSAVVISVSDVDSHVGMTSMSPDGFEFDKDEVIGEWGSWGV